MTTTVESNGPDAIIRFAAFIEQAKRLSGPAEKLEYREDSAAETSIAAFSEFLTRARPLVIEEVRNTLREHRGALNSISRWLLPPPCDILGAAGLNRDEVRYTRLIAWLLWPQGNPDLALRIQRAWLTKLGCVTVAENLTDAAEPKTEVATDDGRADLVMHFAHPEFVVIVEAKIDTEEHATPNTAWQTAGYPAAVRRKLRLPEDHPGIMVFLTPDGREPHGSDVVVTTFEQVISTVSEAVCPHDLNPEMRWAYSAVITHLLTHATPGGADKVEAIRRYARCAQDEMTEELLVRDLPLLGPLSRMLRNTGGI
ncbi:MAG: hypothetical protein O2923_14680 [Verrucomicrobia bacterium]|nr:hypothetical protein [Verrucomicrobiota bacterium]